MKKAILRILLLICGLNVFTACYGMPPGAGAQIQSDMIIHEIMGSAVLYFVDLFLFLPDSGEVEFT